MFLSTMCLDQIYSKEGTAQSLNSGQSPWNQLDFTSIPKDPFGKQTNKKHKNKQTKKLDEKLHKLDPLERGLKGRIG